MNNNESNNELKSLITNLEKYEKDIIGNSNEKNYYFSEQIKKINSINFQNQNSDELAYSLQMIDEEIKKIINQKLKKDISLNELFLCPQCLKKIPLFISFTINEKNDIYVNYLCLCKNKFEAIKLDDLLNYGIIIKIFLQNAILIQLKENIVLNVINGYFLIVLLFMKI